MSDKTHIDTTTALPAVTLEEAKKHLRVDFDDDDSEISAMILSATQNAEHECGHAIITREGEPGFASDVSAVPAAIKMWVLMRVAAMYERRDSENGTTTPLAFVDHLLDPYRCYL